MKILKQENKGITLIALVVTIVVTIILAGISITSLTGDNGVIKEANDSKVQTERKANLEELQSIVVQSSDNRGNFDLEKVKDNIKRKIIGSEVDEEATEFPLKVTIGQHKYIVDEDGEVIEQ